MSRAIYIQLEDDKWTVHSADTGTGDAPQHTAKQNTPYRLSVAFLQGTVAQELAGDVTASLILKRKDRYATTAGVTERTKPRIINANVSKTGTGTSTRYTFESVLSSTLLDADCTLAKITDYDVEIEWRYDGSTTPFKTTDASTDSNDIWSLQVTAAVGSLTEAALNPFVNKGRSVYVGPDFATQAAYGINAVETFQEAWDYVTTLQGVTPGRAFIFVGSYLTGTAGDATVTGSTVEDITIIGQSVENSLWNSITFDDQATVRLELMHVGGGIVAEAGTIQLTGVDSEISINANGYEDILAPAVYQAGAVTVTGNIYMSSVSLVGGTSTSPGIDGTAGGTLTLLQGARANAVDVSGGNGGDTGLDGGDGGAVNVGLGCTVDSVTLAGGTAGSGGANGADGVVNGYSMDIPALASVPPSAPVSGGRLYFDGTALKYKLANGTIKTVTVT